MRPLILASTSPYRANLLRQLGVPFDAHSAHVDEEVVKKSGLEPREVARVLARQKAEALAEQFPDAILIGGDQVAEVDGLILDKPGTVEKSIAQLKRLSGRTHSLWTALALHDATTGTTCDLVHEHRMTLRALSDGQIRQYVERDQPLDCCGSYKIESLGIALFEKIEGHDHTAIVGLPLMELVTLLGEMGITIPPEGGEVEERN